MSTTPFLNTQQLQWLEQQCTQRQQTIQHIVALQEHADHRKYYRIITQSDSIICMHALTKFNATPFLESTHTLSHLGLPIAQVLSHSENLKLTLIEDFGKISLLSLAKLRHSDYLFYYYQSIDTLIDWQRKTQNLTAPTSYDQNKAITDTQLCITWFCHQWANINLNRQQQVLWEHTLTYINDLWQQIPQTICHRDYHADNLLVTNHRIGIIDHQDLAHGPIYYDIASLLNDHYITHTPELQDKLLSYYLQHSQGTAVSADLEQYHIVVYQRHLKNLGIFCRLHCRDNKSWYLKFLPRMLHVMDRCATQLPKLRPLTDLLYRTYLTRTSLHSTA